MRSIRALRNLLLLTQLALCGCFNFPAASYYYPSDIVQPSRQLFAWPASETAVFRFLAQSDACGLANWNRLADKFNVESDSERIHALAAQASSLTVLVRADTDPVVRSRATSMLERLGRELPRLSTHCVVVNADLSSVRNGVGLHRVLSDQAAFHAEALPPDFASGITLALVKYIATEGTPDYLVVPLSPGSDRIAVYGNLRVDGTASAVTECTASEALGLLQTRLLDPRTRKTMDQRMDLGAQLMTPIERTDQVFVVVLVPIDAPVECRTGCERLAQDLCSATLAPISIAFSGTCWTWSECGSGGFIRENVPLDSVCSIMTGPVRQFGVMLEASGKSR